MRNMNNDFFAGRVDALVGILQYVTDHDLKMRILGEIQHNQNMIIEDLSKTLKAEKVSCN